MAMNAAGAIATGSALVVIVISKFVEGAWLTVFVIPAFVILLRRIRHAHDLRERELTTSDPLETACMKNPLVVIPLRRLDRVSRKALRFALTISSDVYAVQVLAEDIETDNLAQLWPETVERPVRESGHTPPRLLVVRSPYREFVSPFLAWVRSFSAQHPDREIAVIIPEVVRRRWYHLLVSHRATELKTLLLLHGDPRIVVISTPWYLEDERLPL
jgi:hypothetical protein